MRSPINRLPPIQELDAAGRKQPVDPLFITGEVAERVVMRDRKPQGSQAAIETEHV